MRTGLVLLGVAFLVVGGTALASIFLVPPATTEVRHDSSASLSVGSAGRTTSILLWGENGSSAAFSLRWQASAAALVWLWSVPNGASCTAAPCPAGVTVAAWNATTSGSWKSFGAPGFPYYLQAESTTNRSLSLQLQATGTATQPESAPSWQALVGSVAGALVVAVGAVALFLGLFLRAGFTRPAPPVPPLGADGVEEHFRRPPG